MAAISHVENQLFGCLAYSLWFHFNGLTKIWPLKPRWLLSTMSTMLKINFSVGLSTVLCSIWFWEFLGQKEFIWDVVSMSWPIFDVQLQDGCHQSCWKSTFQWFGLQCCVEYWFGGSWHQGIPFWCCFNELIYIWQNQHGLNSHQPHWPAVEQKVGLSPAGCLIHSLFKYPLKYALLKQQVHTSVDILTTEDDRIVT